MRRKQCTRSAGRNSGQGIYTGGQDRNARRNCFSRFKREGGLRRAGQMGCPGVTAWWVPS